MLVSDRWRRIWESKGEDVTFDCNLQTLLGFNGFDTKTGTFDMEGYRKFITQLIKRSELRTIESIFEVGCGSGAFLYAFVSMRGGGMNKIGGLDYSENLIKIIRQVFPKYQQNFFYQKADELDSADKYDIVSLFSVMHYFCDLKYAENVVEKMIEKANKQILLLDVLDEAKHQKDIENKKRLYGDQYEAIYGDFPHLSYSKEFFEKIARRHNLRYEIWDQDIQGYSNSEYRFNVIMEK